MAVWSVLVLVGDEAVDSERALDRMVEAIENHPAHLGFSVASGPSPSVFLSVDAASDTDARRAAESIVEVALASIDRAGAPRAAQVYDADGRIVFDATA